MQFLKNFRFAPLVIGLFCIFLIFAWGILFSIYLPTTRNGLVELQNGQDILFTNPTRATEHFSKASSYFHLTATNLQNTSVVLKLLTPLPPFRWYVRLLQASDDLAAAGTQAAAMRQSFPVFDFEKQPDLTTLLTSSGASYCSWFKMQDTTEFQTNLTAASSHLEAIPAWIIVGQKSSIEQLRQQISDVSRRSDWSSKMSQQLCNTNVTTLFIFPQSDGSFHTATLIRNKGKVEKVTFDVEPNTTLLKKNVLDLKNRGETIAQDYALAHKIGVDEVVTMDTLAFTALEKVAGSTDTSQSNTEAYLLSLISHLAIAEQPLSGMQPALQNSIMKKELQFWSSNPEIEKLVEP